MRARPHRTPPYSPTLPRRRPRILRLIRLTYAIVRHALRRIGLQLALFSGWTWIAAGSLIGFEMFDVLFGTFLLAPELIPLVILSLALTWYFRRKLHRTWRRGRARWRLARMARSHD